MTGNTNDTTTLRRLGATLTIGSFSVAALMGIVALLGGGSFGEGEGRVLLTTLVVGCASICALCYLATAGSRWAAVGVVGAVVLVLPLVTSLMLVWGDWNEDMDGLLKAFGVGVVAATTLAQICLLLALGGARHGVALVLWSTVVLAVVLAVLVSGMILGEVDADGMWRLIGVIAILDVLGTLVTIALAKFGDRDAPRVRDGGLRVTLGPEQSVVLHQLSARTGRSPEQLVEDAVDRYVRG